MRPFISHCQAPSPGLAFDAEVRLKTPLGLGWGKSSAAPQGANDELSGGGRTKKRKKKWDSPSDTVNCVHLLRGKDIRAQ